MEMQATRALGVTQEQAWQALNDPEVLKLCIPGCDKVEATAENEYDIGMALRIGQVSAKFKGGPAGFGKGSAQVSLAPNAGGCELAYSVTASVGGKVAQLGQRLIDGAARSLAEDFFRRFDEEMQRRHGAAEPAIGAAAPIAAPVNAQSDSSVLLPALLAAGGGAAAMVVVLGLIWLSR